MPHLTLRECVLPAVGLMAIAGVLSMPRAQRGSARERPAPAPAAPWGTVILPFGRYFAGRADMLTRDGFKTVVPIDGISPFSGVGEPDPQMQHFTDGERVNDRVKIDVRKDLAARLAQADAQFLVVDNSTALQMHREVNGRLYTMLPGEETDLMDSLWNADAKRRAPALKLSHTGLTDHLKSIYDAFVRACLDSFPPARIILVRSHSARFWVGEDGTIALTDVDRRDARFLAALDDYFAEQTGCQVAYGALGHFPSAVKWQTFDHRLRRAIEEDLVELCAAPRSGDPEGDSRPAAAPRVGASAAGLRARVAQIVRETQQRRSVGSEPPGTVDARAPMPEMSVADHVLGAVRGNRPVDRTWVLECFSAGGASYDDLLALAYLDQRGAGANDELIRACVRLAVADAGSRPLAVTRQRFDRSIHALRGWRWRSGRLPRGDRWTPQITVSCGSVVLRFLADGSIQRIPISRVPVSDAEAVVGGRLPVTPNNLTDIVGSWPVYLERARRGITAALRVTISTVDELVDSCSWIDWEQVLDNERVVITTADRQAVRARVPDAKTDLSFIFDPKARVCTVGGGLMDQVTHIALFDDLCTPHGLDYYLDDLRYIWWRSHNGFEASRLAPDLESKRLTRLVSQALIESFREQVMKIRLPWVFNQSWTWYELGLREATVITRDYFNSRRLMEIGPDFPVRVYTKDSELAELIREPPTPLCFYTTQHRIPIVAASAVAIRRVFSYDHLVASGLDPDVARTAERLRSAPHVAFHVRRGDYMNPHFDIAGWHSKQSHYIEAIDHLIGSEFRTSDFNVAVFSDDLEFVKAHLPDYGLDRVTGEVRFIEGNSHYRSIFDSYLMSLCPVIVGSVGFFAATTSLLADPPSVFIRALPQAVRVEWRR